MSNIQDPIADMFTRIRNAGQVLKPEVKMASSRQKVAIAKLLKEEGYIEGYHIEQEETKKPVLTVVLKFFEGKSVIASIKRVSRVGVRVYRECSALPKVMGGLGISIISTSKGLLTDRDARRLGVGGEVIGYVE